MKLRSVILLSTILFASVGHTDEKKWSTTQHWSYGWEYGETGIVTDEAKKKYTPSQECYDLKWVGSTAQEDASNHSMHLSLKETIRCVEDKTCTHPVKLSDLKQEFLKVNRKLRHKEFQFNLQCKKVLKK